MSALWLPIRWLYRWLLLWPLSRLYGLGVGLRNWAYDRGWLPVHRLPVPVLAIGNLSAGGTGKTPMAELLLRRLSEEGHRPAYLSRGYGRRTQGYHRVDPETDTAESVGDEALQVARKFRQLPVAVCEDRVAGVRQLLAEAQPSCVILDDAFQHRRIGRELDLVMIDANRPPWLDHLLPLGRLREPLSSLKRAQLVVVNKVLEEDKIRSFQRRIGGKLAFTRTVALRLVPFWSGAEVIELENQTRRVCIAFAGIGNPEPFYLEIRKLGLLPMRSYRFSDHHRYRPGNFRRIIRRWKRLANQNALRDTPLLVTTEKDAMRLITQPWFVEQYGSYPFYYLEIALEVIRGKDSFEAVIQAFANFGRP